MRGRTAKTSVSNEGPDEMVHKTEKEVTTVEIMALTRITSFNSEHHSSVVSVDLFTTLLASVTLMANFTGIHKDKLHYTSSKKYLFTN